MRLKISHFSDFFITQSSPHLSLEPFLHMPCSSSPFFHLPHPLRSPSSCCTACLLSLEELKVALIWSLGILQTVTEGVNASEWSIPGTRTPLILQEASDACLTFRLTFYKHSGEVMLDVVASGQLVHKTDFAFMCCIGLKSSDVRKKHLWLLSWLVMRHNVFICEILTLRRKQKWWKFTAKSKPINHFCFLFFNS